MRHRLSLMLGLLALCASLAACGGSGTTATATTASPTRAATAALGAASAPAPAVATIAPTTAASSSAATRPAGSAPAATSAATIAATTGAPAVTAPAASAASGGNIVMVQLKDFAITLDKSTVSAGMVTFNIKNNGPSPHNFNVKINGEEKGVPTLDPGTTTTLTLDLTPGTYDYRCKIPGHDLLGMKGTLTVT